jgi:hypothetical protein
MQHITRYNNILQEPQLHGHAFPFYTRLSVQQPWLCDRRNLTAQSARCHDTLIRYCSHTHILSCWITGIWQQFCMNYVKCMPIVWETELDFTIRHITIDYNILQHITIYCKMLQDNATYYMSRRTSSSRSWASCSCRRASSGSRRVIRSSSSFFRTHPFRSATLTLRSSQSDRPERTMPWHTHSLL